MKKVLITMMAVLLTATSVWAEDDLTLLKEQLQLLSARVSQLEEQLEVEKANTARIAQLEKQLKTTPTGSSAPASAEMVARLDMLEKKVEQGGSSSSYSSLPPDVVARLEKLEKRPDIPEWIMNTEIHGDLRFRQEWVEVDGGNKKDRQRVRARIGAYGEVNDYIDWGVRFATGDDSAVSANTTLGDGFKKTDAQFDLWYVDIHPEQFKGVHVLLGKMKQPWLKDSGLIWDGDATPEGIALKYTKQFNDDFKLISSAGGFVIQDNKGDDTRLMSAQIAGEQSFDHFKVLAGASIYNIGNAEEGGLNALPSNPHSSPDTDYNMLEGFGEINTKIVDVPFKIHGQYVVNTDAVYSDDTAWLLGVVLGKAKAPGSWQIGYNYRDTGRDAVVEALHDSDFAGGDTGSYGHSIKAKYQISKNFQAGATYLMAVNGDGDDEDTIQMDLMFKF